MARMETKVVSDKVVYEGAICRVRKLGLETEAGRVVSRDLIEMADAVVIVPVRPDGSVVLIRNERFAVEEELLELPAGKLDVEGEDPAACAARELTEETGYSAGRIERLGGFYSCPGAVTEYMHVFLATDLTAGEQDLQGCERIRVEPTPPDRLTEMIATGQLHDGKSLAAVLLWRMHKDG